MDPDIASVFKRKCKSVGVSIASVLSQFMADYSKSTVKRKAPLVEDSSIKKKRRLLIDHAARLVEAARYGEEIARDNTPKNLQSTERCTASEDSISKMDEIIDLLYEVY